jgi:monoamine oxidase
MYENLPGIDVTFKADHKYTDILKHFTDDIPRENIRLGAKVKKIKMVGAGISLDLEGDERLAADYVIFTPSVGVLKWAVSDGILFDPPLSENKVRAIKSVGFGTVGKIFIR